MNLVFFDFTISSGGSTQGTISLAKRLSENNNVSIIDVYGNSAEYHHSISKAGLPLYVLHPGAKKLYIGEANRPFKRLLSGFCQLKDFWYIRKHLKAVLKSLGPDAVWVNNEKSLVFLLGLKTRAPFPIVYYARGWSTPSQISPLLRYLLTNRVSHVLSHAQASVAELISMGIPSEKITYIPNSVDIYYDITSKKPSASDLPGADRAFKIILPAARPVMEKGHLTAVRALRRIIDKGIDAILWFPGKVATGVSNEFLCKLKHLINELNLNGRVYFIGWRNDLQRDIAQADAVILPSHTEGFPRVIIESMLLKVPVCASLVGGIPEAIFDGKTGFIVDKDDDLFLSNRLIQLYRDDCLRNKITRQAYSLASKKFSSKLQLALVSRVFENIVNT